jgi:hypothetical protein
MTKVFGDLRPYFQSLDVVSFQNRAAKVLNLLFYKENGRKSFGLFCIIENYMYLCIAKR